MREAQCEVTVVRQEDQALGVVVQPSHRIQIAPLERQQVGDDAALLGIAARGDVTLWFVDGNVNLAASFNWSALDRDSVPCGIYFAAKLSDNFAIDLDLPIADQLLRGAARCNSS